MRRCWLSCTFAVLVTLIAYGQEFSNPAPITIPAVGTATPYPTIINVSGVAGVIESVRVDLIGISHTYPDDIDILLVGPTGASVILMSDAGGGNDLVGVNLTFEDAATASLPDSAQIVSGTYRPTNYLSGDTFAAPAPAGPYGSTFAGFAGTDPNGQWSLFVVDDASGDLGQIAGGWVLHILLSGVPGACCLADGQCVELIGADCAGTGGVFHGGGSSCELVQCPQPGACCLPDGACINVADWACDLAGGDFRGATTTCDEVDCPVGIHIFPLDVDPGWEREGQWEFGVPTGGGSHNFDPTSGHTGPNVLGFNLAGDYTNSMPRYYLTTGAMDCTGYEEIELVFWRWLGVESASFDHAGVEVSNDGGATWQTVWEHTGSALSDAAWQRMTYDISTWADQQPDVRLRWAMGTTDTSVTYPGWNIDDILIRGRWVPLGACCTPGGACRIKSWEDCFQSYGYWQGASTSCDPNPCTPFNYYLEIDEQGTTLGQAGDGYPYTPSGQFYYYPRTFWYNMWWPNEFDPTGWKWVDLVFSLDFPSGSGYAEVAINYATQAWTAQGFDRPPLPEDVPTADLEQLYIAREFLGLYTQPGLYGTVDPYPLPYCPSWVSMDIQGYGFVVLGNITHGCESIGGACCLGMTCAPGTTQLQCESQGGIWQGAGTDCFPNPCLCLQPADSNCDGSVNAFDIDPFVMALTAGDQWSATYPCEYMCANDINCDGAVNTFDIDPFVLCLTGAAECSPCP
jgi:subtilisin-like proprotein convertase family protein